MNVRFQRTVALSLAVTYFSAAQQQTLDANDFGKGATVPGAQLLDVRTMKEYQSGHLKNALLADWNDTAVFRERVQHLDRTKPVYTYCLAGVRSQRAAEWLLQHGFARVYNLKGGISAWRAEGLPVEGVASVEPVSLEQFMAAIPSNQTTLVDVGAAWCPPCRIMTPVVDSVIKASQGTVHLITVDPAQQPALVKALGVEELPGFIIYKKGKETSRVTGVITRSTLLRMIQ